MSGDEHAIALVAKTAAEVAAKLSTIPEINNIQDQDINEQIGSNGQIQDNQNGIVDPNVNINPNIDNNINSGISTPEQDLADQLIPDMSNMQVAQDGTQSQFQDANQNVNQSDNQLDNQQVDANNVPSINNNETFDSETVAKLIRLAKSGQI